MHLQFSSFSKQKARAKTNCLLSLLAVFLFTNVATDCRADFPNVDVTVEPFVNGNLVVAHVAPPFNGAADGSQLAIMLFIQNNESEPIELVQATVSFVGGPAAFPFIFDVSVPIPAGETNHVNLQSQPDNNDIFNIKLPFPPPGAAFIELKFDSFSDPATILFPLAKHLNSGGAGSYAFPAKAIDLEPGEYWTGQSTGTESHHNDDQRFAYDMHVIKWDDADDKWIAKTGNNKEDHLAWGKPVYAVADGVIGATDDGQIDIEPGADPIDNGNTVFVRHGTEVVRYAHLMQGSIVVVVDQNVVRGQLLAQVGNSGNTAGPHLHIDCCSDKRLRPLNFTGPKVILRDLIDPDNPTAGPWYRLRINALPWTTREGGKTAILPVNDCALQRLVGRGAFAMPGAGLLSSPVKWLDLLRRFRDEKLNQTEDGKLLTKLYYRNSGKFNAIFLDNPSFAMRLVSVVVEAGPQIEATLGNSGTPMLVTPAQFANGLKLIEEFESYADANLKRDLQLVQNYIAKRAEANRSVIAIRFSD